MNRKPPIIISHTDLVGLERLIAMNDQMDPYLEALQAKLDRAEIVPQRAVPSNLITMNTTTCCVEDSTGKEYVLTLTYPHQATEPGSVSVLAPIGTALLGLSVGQRIECQGSKTLKLRVLAVRCVD